MICEKYTDMEYRAGFKLSNRSDQKPLTLALSQRERGLTEVICEKYTDMKYRVELKTEPDQKPNPLLLTTQ